MLNPFLLAVLSQLTDTDEDLELMCRPMEEWTDAELERMAKKIEKFMGAQ